MSTSALDRVGDFTAFLDEDFDEYAAHLALRRAERIAINRLYGTRCDHADIYLMSQLPSVTSLCRRSSHREMTVSFGTGFSMVASGRPSLILATAQNQLP